MKHVSSGDKSLLVGDDAADTLLEYARLIGDAGRVDSVTLRAISPDGNTVEAGILLNMGTALIVESTNSDLEPPDNAEVVEEMKDRIRALSHIPIAQPETDWSEPNPVADY